MKTHAEPTSARSDGGAGARGAAVRPPSYGVSLVDSAPEGAVIQRYTDEGGVKTSDAGNMVLAGEQELYAHTDVINASNLALAAVAGGRGAFYRLAAGAGYAENDDLKKVTPTWQADRAGPRSYHRATGLAQADGFKTQNDCYMTGSLSAGIDDRDTGIGEETYGKYKVLDRRGADTGYTTESSAPLDTGMMKARGVATPSLAGGGLPYHAAFRNMYRFYILSMPLFRDWADTEYAEGSLAHSAEDVTYVRTKIVAPIAVAAGKAADELDKTALQDAIQAYMRIYADISAKPELIAKFSSMFGVNESMAPDVGDALAIMNDPKEREAVQKRIGLGDALDELWNYHFAGVALKDGTDYITLENAADETHAKINADWIFDMYSSAPGKPAQSFHGALKGGAHGPGIGASPLTMAFTAGTPPSARLHHPTANEVITSDTYTLNIEPLAGANNVRVSVDSGPWQQPRKHEGRFYYDWAGYEEGQHTLKVEAWNVAGQRTELKTVRVTYSPA